MLQAAKAYWQLLRPLNCLMAAVAAIVGFAVSSGGLHWDPRLPALFAAAFLICGAGQAINDYYDRRIDARKKADKPIPSGRIGAMNAFAYSVALFAAGNLLCWRLLGPSSLALSLAYTILLFAYASMLNRAKYVGNIVVASATGATYLFGATLTGDFALAAVLACCALLANYGREVAKDLEDIGADRGAKTTLPMVAGNSAAGLVSAAAYLLSIPFAVAPAFVPALANGYPQLIPLISASARIVVPRFVQLPFLVLIALSSAVMLRAAWAVLKRDYPRSQRLAKAAMALALLAYLAALISV